MEAPWPSGQASFRVYRRHAGQTRIVVRISLLLAMELALPALALDRLDRARRRLLQLVLRGLVVRGADDDAVPRGADVLHLHRDDVLLPDLLQGVADRRGAVGGEAGELEVPIDRHEGRDDVLLRHRAEGLRPLVLEARLREGAIVHGRLLERAEQRPELVDEVLAERREDLVRGLPQLLRDEPEELLRLLLVLELLDLLALLVLVDALEREVDLPLRLVDADDLADDLLPLAHVVPDVLDPARGDLGDVDEALEEVPGLDAEALLLALGLPRPHLLLAGGGGVLVEPDERPEILHVVYGADDEVPFLGQALRAGHLLLDPQDLALDRREAAGRLGEGGAADEAGHRGRGAVEHRLLIAAVAALHLEELRPDRAHCSFNSNFPARMHRRWWAFLHCLQR